MPMEKIKEKTEWVKKIYIAYEDWSPCIYWYAIDWYDKDKNEYSVIYSHMSSNEWFLQIDMWLCPWNDARTGKKARTTYDKIYPNWYELVWFWMIWSHYDESRLQDLLEA